MNTSLHSTALFFALACSLSAAPIDYEEVSLLIRMHETESFVAEQAWQRGLLRVITPQQEATLKAQGASDTLLNNLRNPHLILPESEAVALETRRDQQRKAAQETSQPAPLRVPASYPATIPPVEADYCPELSGYYPYLYGGFPVRRHGLYRHTSGLRRTVSAQTITHQR